MIHNVQLKQCAAVYKTLEERQPELCDGPRTHYEAGGPWPVTFPIGRPTDGTCHLFGRACERDTQTFDGSSWNTQRGFTFPSGRPGSCLALGKPLWPCADEKSSVEGGRRGCGDARALPVMAEFQSGLCVEEAKYSKLSCSLYEKVAALSQPLGRAEPSRVSFLYVIEHCRPELLSYPTQCWLTHTTPRWSLTAKPRP